MIFLKINDYISLRLENEETKIFVNNEQFLICKAVLLNTPFVGNSEITTMDDLFERSELIEGEDLKKYGIDSETQFWVHCSSFQTWVENNYNSDLLETTLAFPLLKRLTEVGDKMAKRKFKEEIARRYKYGSFNNQMFLEREGYLDFLSKEELINGILDLEESTLLFEIHDCVKQFGILYDLVLTFDEDRYRHRLDHKERFFTIFKGHIHDFEFDMTNDSYRLFNSFPVFKSLERIIIYLGEMEQNLLDSQLSNLESVRKLEIFQSGPFEIPTKLIDNFPNLIFLRIQSSIKKGLKDIKSILSLRNLKELHIYNCYSENIHKDLLVLKNRGVRILVREKGSSKWEDVPIIS